MNSVTKKDEIEKYKKNYILSINSIFEAWKEAQNTDYPFNAVTKENGDTFEINSFAQDGILNVEDYYNSEIKVLFIMREANFKNNNTPPNQRCSLEWFQEFIDSNGNSKHPCIQEKIARMAFYLQNPQLSYEQRTLPNINQLIKALSSSAIMNLNKRGGIGRCYELLLRRYVKNEGVAKCIYDEIKLINPDVIVLLATGEFLYSSKLPDKRRVLKCLEDEYIVKYMWHPSYIQHKSSDVGLYSCNNSKKTDAYMREFFKRNT